jgi:glutamate-1-semialdehyde 2,1-aminomutase
VVGNMGVLVPKPGFLDGVRDACKKAGALFIVDEVMTGFRLSRGGAQARLNVRGDLTAFGKVIGGGLPVGALGGSRELMRHLAPAGPIYQAGTLSGNPLAMAAGLATLEALADPNVYEKLEETGATLEAGLRAAATAAKVPHQLNRVGSMWTLFFADAPVTDAASARLADRQKYARFFHGMLDRGVYLPPSQFESAFLSIAHGPAEIAAILDAARSLLAEIGNVPSPKAS